MKSTGSYQSDLVSSYAWDTVIMFIQKYSGKTNYANQTSVNSSILNTGKSKDVVCNIYDVASNCTEWSTEYNTSPNSYIGRKVMGWTARGGDYWSSKNVATCRYGGNVNGASTNISFRLVLYVQ